jgi:hypothetical protein
MQNNPTANLDEQLVLKLLDLVAQQLTQFLNQRMVLENKESIEHTQLKIDRLRQQLDRLRAVLRKQKETESKKTK